MEAATPATSTDELLKLALVGLLKKERRGKPRIVGISEEGCDGSEGDGLRSVMGARSTMALERLHKAMLKHPGAFADRMENLAAAVDGGSVSSSVGIDYVRDHLPVGKQRTFGYLMFITGLTHQALKEQQFDKARFLCMASLAMGEQFCLDENWMAAWKIFGLPTPPWSEWSQEDVAALKREHAHSRLVDSRWAGAAVGAFKDEEVLRRRRGKGSGKRDSGGEADKDK